MNTIKLWFAALTLSAAVLTHAAEKSQTEVYTDPQKAGPDYAYQGEYANGQLGAQVIALGNGRFRAVFHKGGLPGAGWDKSAKVEINGERDGDKLAFSAPSSYTATLANGALTGSTASGDHFILKKIIRTSPTAGAKPPPGAVVLFDGKNVEAWAGGRMDEEKKLLRVGTKTKQSFTNFTLHLEFILPFMPTARGQGRANSGVYVQDRYECQVLDSFGLKGENNECGGFYTKAKPAVNMCFPPLTWQTYDIDFTTAAFDADGKKIRNSITTVRHNGVVIHDRLEMDGPTPGGKPENASGGVIQFQDHSNPVLFRNVWVVEK